MSQLALAIEADISPRHMCFIETGRSQPSREMIQLLAEVMDVPLRERNALLLAAGYAPTFREADIDLTTDDLAPVRAALDAMLRQQEPFPALVMDRHWDVLMTNDAASRFFAFLLGDSSDAAPANVLRMMFDPTGLRPFVKNWEAAAEALVQRVHREAVGGILDDAMRRLLDDLLSHEGVPTRWRTPGLERPQLPVIPVIFERSGRTFSYFSTVTTLGTPQDVLLQELRIESFFPFDDETRNRAREIARLAGFINADLHCVAMSDERSESRFPIDPPIAPMLAKLSDSMPRADGFLFEPKWDGFRAIVFRGAGDVFIQSRDRRPFDRYFPELHDALIEKLPSDCVLDGEIVIMTPTGLDFDALQMRLHPAASRVAKLADEIPASFVAFDLLAADGRSLMDAPQSERRQRLERLLTDVGAPVYLTPMTRDQRLAEQWLDEFEGAGLDGVIAKPVDLAYVPGKRAMIKIKHARTADCVVAGFRWYRGGQDAVGSLLLGLYDDDGRLHHVGVTSSFTRTKRKELVAELAPLRENALESHPWGEWAQPGGAAGTRMPGGQSRWSTGKDLSWEPLRIERVCEVKYDHLQGDRFRHAATFLRWRPDKQPSDCRYDQLEVTQAYDLDKVFSSGASGS